jgi:hypothetical protein
MISGDISLLYLFAYILKGDKIMGKMKELAIRIDEIMEKIEESLDGLDELSKVYIYDSLSTRCILRVEQVANGPKKDNKDDKRSIN